jgi:hypothetical protein
VSRQRAQELQLSEGELVIARAEVDALHDDLYVLACAVDDVTEDLGAMNARPTVKGLSDTIEYLLQAAKPLRDRALSAPGSPNENK